MKKAVYGLLLILIYVKGVGQTVSIVKGQTVMHPVVSNDDKENVQAVKIALKLEGDAPTDASKKVLDKVMVNVSLSADRTSSVKPSLITSTVEVLAEDWKKGTVEKTVVVKTYSTKTFGDDEKFYIVLNEKQDDKNVKQPDKCQDCNHEVRVTTSGVFDRNKAFWMEVGANFDLVDGVEPNNFFTGVFFYKRDIRPLFYRGDKKVMDKQKDLSNKKFLNYQRSKNLAVFAGVFESKSITSVTENNFSLRKYYDSSSLIPNNADSMKLFTGIGNYVKRTTVRNVGLFFSPQVRITSGSANDDGLHLFVSMWAELQWQRIREERIFNQIRRLDTGKKLPIVDIISNPEYNTSNEVKETDVRSHYLGIGFPIFFQETVANDVVQLFVNPTFGFTNQPSTQYLDAKTKYDFLKFKTPDLQPPHKDWSPFYVVQFRLNEESYGIAFTGEVRGLLKRDNQPFVSISLTKKFDLTKFIEYSKK